MLCDICQAIFSKPRKLSCGTYYPWGHTDRTFAAAREADCHICNLVWENGSYDSNDNNNFANHCTYAFKVLNPEWARRGEGPKWVVPTTRRDSDADELSGISRYLQDMENDSMINHVANLLESESDEIFNESVNFWLVLDFYCPGPRIVLPLEIVRGDDLEHIAQTKLEEQTSTGSKENLQLASSWLHDCINNHPQCRPIFDENWLPTRLIYLGVLDSPVLRIVSTSSLPHSVPYATLSHRWGRTTNHILTSKLLSIYETEIPISDVSATLRDAFHATRSIGLEYLWVDSICIVQDDPDDWSQESVTMSKVYGLSTCTIAAAVGGDGDNGCFADRNQYKVRPCVIPNPFSKESTLSFYLRSQYLNQIHKREVKDSAWYNRGWVFQERTLSPRLLIFGKTQIVWACSKLQAAETWPCGKTSDDFIDRFESFEIEKSRLQTLLDKERIISPFDTTWSTFILDYTRSNLTRMSDRLIALQGLASRIETQTGRSYCAGLWIDSTLPSSLLWSAVSAELPRSREYRAPTWSWASVDGPIVFGSEKMDYEEIEVLIEVLGTIILPVHQWHISQVPLAGLRFSGSTIPATFIPPSGSDRGELIMRPYLPSNKMQDALWTAQKRIRCWWRKMKSWWLQVVKICMDVVFLRFIIACLTCPFTSLWCLLDIFCGFFIPYGRIEQWFNQIFGKTVDMSLHAAFILDIPLLGYDELDVVCLPIMASKARRSYHGLILQSVRGKDYQYERLGIFSFGFSPLVLPLTKQVFTLV